MEKGFFLVGQEHYISRIFLYHIGTGTRKRVKSVLNTMNFTIQLIKNCDIFINIFHSSYERRRICELCIKWFEFQLLSNEIDHIFILF